MIIARLVAEGKPDLVYDHFGKFSCPEDERLARRAQMSMSVSAHASPSVPRTLQGTLGRIAEETGRTLIDVAIPQRPSPFERRVY